MKLKGRNDSVVYYGDDLFKGTAKYYSKYRPIYPASLIRYLIRKFSLDGKGHLLDLGCGTGQLAFRFSDWFEKIVGIDTDPEMITEAIDLSKDMRIENIQFFNGNLDKYKVNAHTFFKLVTIAKAFHWMDREMVLETLYEMIPYEGGIAIIDSYSPNKELSPWQKTVNEVVKQWYGHVRRAGDTTYSHPTISHQQIVANSKFELDVYQLPTYEYYWSVETIIGHLYSTSFGAKRFLGDNVNSFEQNLREELLSIEETGVFKEQVNITVIMALKK